MPSEAEVELQDQLTISRRIITIFTNSCTVKEIFDV